jgi:hypothetical protein
MMTIIVLWRLKNATFFRVSDLHIGLKLTGFNKTRYEYLKAWTCQFATSCNINIGTLWNSRLRTVALTNNVPIFLKYTIGNILQKNIQILCRYKVRDNCFSVHNIKAYMGSRDIIPLILNVSTRWICVLKPTLPASLTPETSLGSHWVGGWAVFIASMDILKEKSKISLPKPRLCSYSIYNEKQELGFCTKFRSIHNFR